VNLASNNRIGVRLLGLIAFATASMALSSCGGSGAAAPPGSRQNPLVAQPTEQTSNGRSNEARAQSSEQPNYQKLVARQSSRPASRFTPCNLVSRAQASAILGSQVMAPIEAPQGPTCIYRSQNGKAFTTLAVQHVDIGKLRKQMRQPQTVGIAQHTGYCGTYGQPVLYVQLSRKRVLTVAAPCRVAKAFAARAVVRLSR
jgi:hypothetical protein